LDTLLQRSICHTESVGELIFGNGSNETIPFHLEAVLGEQEAS
jgi:hypothetical protein